MHKYQLSMRCAHGKKVTFFESIGKNFKSRKLIKNLVSSLNFAIHNTHRSVQSNDLKNKGFIGYDEIYQ